MSDITATSVKLTWSYKDPDEVQYYVIQHKPKHVNQAFAEISGITTMYYHVRSLSPYTEYELYVIVVNAIGRGPPSAPVTVTTGETSQYFLFLLTPPPPTLYLRIFSFSHFIHWRARARSSPKIFRMFSFERVCRPIVEKYAPGYPARVSNHDRTKTLRLHPYISRDDEIS